MKKLSLLLIGATLLLASCVIPEKFTCAINVDKQGAYSVDFKGTLLFWAALEEVSEQGRVSSETDGEIKEIFDEWVAGEPTIRKYEYRNSGRAYIEYYQRVVDGTSLDLSEDFGMPLSVSVDSGGNIIITEEAVESSELTEFVKLGYKLDGVIEITSELPIVDAGGQRVGKKYVLFGPQVIKQVLRTFPKEDVVIRIGKN